MGAVTWHASAIVHASPDDVWAWMTDFTSDDHNGEAYLRGAGQKRPKKPAMRTIVSREGNVLRIEDRWNGSTYRQTVTLDPSTRSYRIEASMGYDATWRAVAEGGATRYEVDGRMGRGALGSLMALFRGPIRRSMEADFRGHAEELREAMAAARKGSSP